MKLIPSAALMLACLVGTSAMAQYPDKPIRMLIPAAPGGGVDLSGRIIASALSESLGKAVVPENRSGAGTVLATNMLAHAPADGYTILMVTASFSVNTAVRKSLPFDPDKDFTPVAEYAYTPDLLVLNAKSNIKSLADLIAQAKANPGKLTYGNSGVGTLSQLEPELLKQKAGVNILSVPYNGGTPAVTAVVGNQVNMLFLGVVAVAPMIKSGMLRAIASTGTEPAHMFPAAPPMAKQGFPDWNTGTWYGVMVPAHTPPAVVETLRKSIEAALKQKTVRDKLDNIGLEPTYAGPAQFSALIKSDTARWVDLVKQNPSLKLAE